MPLPLLFGIPPRRDNKLDRKTSSKPPLRIEYRKISRRPPR